MRLLLIALAAYAADAPRLVFVNGGGSETSNYDLHDEEARSFTEGLFGGKGVHLSAGGAKSLVVMTEDKNQGEIMRDASGVVRLRESDLPYPAAPATKASVLGEIDKLKTDKVGAGFFVFGDHGDPAGVALWNGDTLPAEDWIGKQRTLPPSTVVRSVHLHCYGGRAIVNPERRVPREAPALGRFVLANYRANSCSFALAAHDEIAQYEGMGKKAKDLPWSKFFTEVPKPTLDDFKERAAKVKELPSTPVSTSDYLAHDLAEYFCKNGGMGAAAAKRDRDSHRLPDRLHRQQDTTDVCAAMNAQDVLTASLDVRLEQKANDELASLSSALAAAYIEKTNPALDKAYTEAMKRIEDAKASLTLKRARGVATPADEEAFLAIAKRERGPRVIDYEKLHMSLSDLGKDINEMEALRRTPGFIAWFEKEQKEHRRFRLASVYTDDRENARKSLSEIRDEQSKALEKRQLTRKTLELKLQARIKAFVKAKLEGEPALEEVKATYDSIRKCETTPAN